MAGGGYEPRAKPYEREGINPSPTEHNVGAGFIPARILRISRGSVCFWIASRNAQELVDGKAAVPSIRSERIFSRWLGLSEVRSRMLSATSAGSAGATKNP